MDLKNRLSNYAAIILVLAVSAHQYLGNLNGQPVNWEILTMTLAVAFLGYITGKNNDLKKPLK